MLSFKLTLGFIDDIEHLLSRFIREEKERKMCGRVKKWKKVLSRYLSQLYTVVRPQYFSIIFIINIFNKMRTTPVDRYEILKMMHWNSDELNIEQLPQNHHLQLFRYLPV